MQFYLDDKKCGAMSILYNDPDVTSTTADARASHELTAGDHTLTMEIVGANEKAVKGYMFGIDAVKCGPVAP